MAILCPVCGRQYDVTLFQFGKEVLCNCGRKLEAGDGHRTAASLSRGADRKLYRMAANVRAMIADEAVSRAAVLEAVRALRSMYEELHPDDEEGFFARHGEALSRLFRIARKSDLFKDLENETL
jgi:hypothetical protein